MQRGAWIAVASWAALAGAARAQEVTPTDGAVGMLTPATEIMREIEAFHGWLLWIIVAISLLVLALLLWVMARYNRHANPTPKKFTHNMTVEVIWTIVPVLILVAIAWKSFPLIYKEERVPPNAELTLKVTGNSWFWSFEYPDLGLQVVSNPLTQEDAAAQGRPYLLAVDNPLYVPVDTTVRVLVTSNDVIHAFAVPSFGVKEDAIQGRVNDTWFRVDRPGIYYGQCSELCGINHAYMPLEIHAVSREEFDRWVLSNGGSLAAAEGEAGETPAEPAPAQASPAAQPTR